MEEIKRLFNRLSEEDQVAIMIDLYCSMYDGQKDEFLEETENA